MSQDDADRQEGDPSTVRAKRPFKPGFKPLPRPSLDGQAAAPPGSLLIQDLLDRRQQEEESSLDDVGNRSQAPKDSLPYLLHGAAGTSIPSDNSGHALVGLPSVGDKVFGFRLLGELGRGAFARVYLAEQTELAGRPVVLKITAISGIEPQTLAQLQHTHIVPIYSLHENERLGLRAVCMPYFGGTSLSQVLEHLFKAPQAPVQGQQLVDALAALQGPAPATREDKTTLALLGGLSYIQSAAWLVARLAEALHHAHQRGVLHRDLKPSNILLSAEGQPLLLDFNLAHNQRNAAQTLVGGTVAYMAPEHLRALAHRGEEHAQAVDERSDIYSLGMVLFEILTGHSPFEHCASYSALPMQIEAMAVERSKVSPSVRQQRPEVQWGLESIVRKCLAANPLERYQRAEHLAEDLIGFLNDQPLRYAPELSRAERVVKWSRRHPRLTSSGSVAALATLVLASLVTLLLGVREHLASEREANQAAQAREQKRAYDAGTVRALSLVNTVSPLQDHLRQAVEECENTLAIYGVLTDENWQERAAWRQPPPEERKQLAEETRELLVQLAWARVRLTGLDPVQLRAALALLDRAEAIADLEPSRAVCLNRASYLEQLGDGEQAAKLRREAEAMPPAGAQDHYLLAVSHLVQGGPENSTRALKELDRALTAEPRLYWAWVLRGICHQEQRKFTLAAGDFGTCIGLWPEFAWGYYNRGYVLGQAGNWEEAVRDYTAAIKRDPKLVQAFMQRGMTYWELHRYEAALGDFDQSLRLGLDHVFVHSGRATALEALGRHREADEAFRQAFARLQTVPATVRSRLRWIYGFAVLQRLPQQAEEAFAAVLKEDPQQAQALYGLALLLLKREQLKEALPFLNQALASEPQMVEARGSRALLYARIGNLREATEDINRCLESLTGIDGLRRGAVLYTAACVAARMAEQQPASNAGQQALALLRNALALGYGREKAAGDADLAGLRSDPEFRKLLPEGGVATLEAKR